MVMKEERVSCSYTVMSEENIDTLYPMFFGVSCAFFALNLLPETQTCDGKWSEIRNRILKSAHLLGLLLWRVQSGEAKNRKSELLKKLEDAEKQVEELKKRRSEEAKANEKVVSIVAAREHSWSEERKRLRQHICALMNDLRAVKTKKDNSIAELSRKLKETEDMLQLKDKSVEEMEKKRLEIEEKVKQTNNLVEELRENAHREAQRHAGEILKHKTAFIELVSSQRQLEAEMSRAVRQVEVAKQELDSVLDHKEQAVLVAQRLSMELVRMRKDLEQKDQILSAMVRKSKLDSAEKQMLLKEVKSSKVKRQQSKQDRYSLRNVLSKHVDMKSGNGVGVSIPDPYLNPGTDEKELIAGVEHLENWVDSDTTKYAISTQQRHNRDIDAFIEQLRLKDEELEASRWRLLSMEIESKRLHSHVEALDHDITRLRKENMKLKALLMDRETELHSLKEQLLMQFSPANLQKLSFDSSLQDTDINHKTVWSKVKVVKRKPGQKRQDMKAITDEISQPTEKENVDEQEAKVASMDESILNSDAVAMVAEESKRRNPAQKMDIHALGVSYKIKRLKQQFFMLERSTGKQQANPENSESIDVDFAAKGLHEFISLLNKQVGRYQSFQEKTDELCRRMDDSDLNLNCRGSAIAITDDETERLQHFLEETFQLQRYIVSTGQKLSEVQAKIASGFVDVEENIEKSDNFDVKRFADWIGTLFREVQRGLEVRISRIIGDVEGTLACDGIVHLKNSLEFLIARK